MTEPISNEEMIERLRPRMGGPAPEAFWHIDNEGVWTRYVPEARVTELEGALRGIAQYHPDWDGQRINNQPNRLQLIERAVAALTPAEGTEA